MLQEILTPGESLIPGIEHGGPGRLLVPKLIGRAKHSESTLRVS